MGSAFVFEQAGIVVAVRHHDHVALLVAIWSGKGAELADAL